VMTRTKYRRGLGVLISVLSAMMVLVSSAAAANAPGEKEDPYQALLRQQIQKINLTEEQEEQFQRFDEWAVGYLAEQSERLFKKKLTPDQVREGYRSPVTKKGSYRGHLRCKINSAGGAMVRSHQAEGNSS